MSDLSYSLGFIRNRTLLGMPRKIEVKPNNAPRPVPSQKSRTRNNPQSISNLIYEEKDNTNSIQQVDMIYIYDDSLLYPHRWTDMDEMAESIESALEHLNWIRHIYILSAAELSVTTLQSSVLHSVPIINVTFEQLSISTHMMELSFYLLPDLAHYFVLIPRRIKFNYSVPLSFFFQSVTTSHGVTLQPYLACSPHKLENWNSERDEDVRYQNTLAVLNQCLTEDYFRCHLSLTEPIPLTLTLNQFCCKHIEMKVWVEKMKESTDPQDWLDALTLYLHVAQFTQRGICKKVKQ